MSKLQLKISLNTQTEGFQYYYPDYQEKNCRPTEVKKNKELRSLLSQNSESAHAVELYGYNDDGLQFKLLVKREFLANGAFEVSAHPSDACIKVSIDADFDIEIDDGDTIKYIKKAMKTGTLRIAIVGFRMKRPEIPFAPFGLDGGFFQGCDGENFSAMPQAEIIGSDFAAAPKKPSTKTVAQKLVDIPVKLSIKKELNKAEVAATQKAVREGISLDVSLHIPGGSNSFIARPEDFKGDFDVKIEKSSLVININAVVNYKPDSWMKKYKSAGPFVVQINSYWDGEGNKIFLIQNSDSYESIEVGVLGWQ